MAIIVRKRKKGTVYLVRVQDREGNWFPAKSFTRRVDAEIYEREQFDQRENGSRAVKASMRNMLFKDYFVKWAAECRGKLSAGWKDSQDRMAKNYLLPVLGNLALLDVGGSDVSRALNEMRTQGLAEGTVRHAYNLMSKMFKDAIDEYELLATSPVRRKYRPNVRLTERAFLPPVDAWKLLEAAKHDAVGPAIWIATLAGLRAGEIQALKVGALDFDNSQILIRATFCRRSMVLQDYPKQGDWGRAPMALPLREYLRSIVDGKSPDEFVLNGERDEMMSYNAFLRSLGRLCKAAGVSRVTPHELRHSCTELYVEQGASQEDLRRLLNHSSLTATQRYIHRTDGRLNSIAASIHRPTVLPPPPDTQRKLQLVK